MAFEETNFDEVNMEETASEETALVEAEAAETEIPAGPTLTIDAVEQTEERYCKGFVTVLGRIQPILRHPEKPVGDYYALLNRYIVVSGIFAAAVLLLVITSGFGLIQIAGLMAGCVSIFLTVSLKNAAKKNVKNLMKDSPTTYTLSESGIGADKAGEHLYDAEWKTIRALKETSGVVVFLPAKGYNTFIVMPDRYTDAIIEYMSRIGLDKTVYR